jgi:drug/metabolite transporter (DMT)-like permease
LIAQAIRYLAAAVFLVLMSRVAGVQVLHPRGSEWLWLAGIAATGLVLFNVAIVRGASHAERAAMAVAVACVPVLIGLPGPLLDRQRPSQQVVLAAVVVTIGGVIVEGTGRIDASGIGWAIVALLCEAAFTLLAIPVSRGQGAWGVSLHTVWIASAMLLALGIFVEGAQAAVRLRTDHWAAIGYLAVMVTAVAFVCWYSSVAIIGAPRAGLLTGIAPPAATLAGAVTIGQAPALPVWLGMGAVCTGLAIGIGSRRRTAARDAKEEGIEEPQPLHSSAAALLLMSNIPICLVISVTSSLSTAYEPRSARPARCMPKPGPTTSWSTASGSC